MRAPARFALRLLVVIAVVAALQLLFSSIGPEGTPYASSLSSITASDALAQGCAFRGCRFLGERPRCRSTTEPLKCAQHGNNCMDSPC